MLVKNARGILQFFSENFFGKRVDREGKRGTM
jgi:hypothetical protein